MKFKTKIIFVIVFATCLGLKAQAYQPAVVSAHPAASRVGLEILKKGGSAADAAIATAFALSVVEPHNSGLGGGGFLLYYEAKENRFLFVDYRESAPAKVNANNFTPETLANGITSVAVPGFAAGMEAIHQKWHTLPWENLLEPSIQLAKKGFFIQGKLLEKIQKNHEKLAADGESKKIFLAVTPKLIQSDLATTLEQIKTEGATPFYRGTLADQIANYALGQGGFITKADLADYRVHFRKPHHFKYGPYRVTSAPLPSSGGEGLDLLFRRARLYELASKSGSDKARTLLQGFKDYFEYRDSVWCDLPNNIIGHTTHLNVIDAEGNIAVMTNTLNSNFGSGLTVPGTGILLNNEMDDFSLSSVCANRIRPGTRPLSSMSPTIVFKGANPYLAIGTPGGTTIPQNLFQVLFDMWENKNMMARAVASPKAYFNPRTREVMVEEKYPASLVTEIKKTDPVVFEDSIGNVQALMIVDKKRTQTYSDPRGEGQGFTLGSGRTVTTTDKKSVEKPTPAIKRKTSPRKFK